MAPEQTSPYWDRIVGNRWPQIPPSAWHSLANNAREGAAALNLADVEQARHAFEETVQQSVGLAEIRRALLALEENPRAFASALSAAADTFDTFGDVIRRTRNQILDVVGDATDRIEKATRGDNNDDGEVGDAAEAEADRQAADAIVADARGDVRDIVSAALSSLGPQGLPRLDDIAEALGQPGPWRKGGGLPGVAPHNPGGPGGPGRHHDVPGRNRPGFEPGPWVPGFDRPVRPDPILGQILIDLIDDLLYPGPGPGLPGMPPGLDVQLPVGVGDMPPALTDPPGQTDTGPAPAVPNPGHGAPGVPQPGQQAENAAPPMDTGGGTAEPGVDGAGVDEAGVDEAGADEAADSPSTEAVGETDVSAQPDRAIPAREGTDTPDPWGIARQAGAHLSQDPAAESASPGAVPPVLPPAVGPAAVAATTSAVSGANAAAPASSSVVSGTASTSAAATSTQAGRGVSGPIEANRGPGATGKPLTSASPQGASAAPVGKQPMPVPDSHPGTGKSHGPGDLVQDAMGAAMISASAPAFVVGERVDGDLVLARTLLGGIRAATDSWVVGVDWAVAVLRHPSGVSAFVTSNEGRGWLPARLHLPTEVSLPWLWAVSQGSEWEGVADPARILVEFAIAWGMKSGAKLSALASSQAMDPALGRLGTVALAGSVPASDTMDLRSPTAGTLDRLGITAAPRLLDRAAKVADRDIALRCLELAVDAHTRVGRAELATVDTMEAPQIRLRILRALRDGRDFADSWWEELQDIDDLIAATTLGHRADTSRIGLGELRSDAADLDPGSELSILRALTFQRRCNELVLLLAEEKSRQTVRDSVYAHAQVLGHPLFTAPPAAAPAPRRATITTGARR
ncbi:hypothetical protein [Nocardia jinanensis]|uniref:Uncharacterized protein n=1 Tax=Nocardia jinanensis TaxID=382504 RepID=A0A917RXD8_9NOCA|nr:hypothetical protein [Nocardia jinanensis]GGL40553.1 hypothetical protein GCM10011588_64120 [Nocardia jinanensis]